MDPFTIAIASLAISGISAGFNWFQSRRNSVLQDEQLTNQMESNYLGYMQQISSMEAEAAQNETAINQTREDVATNRNYLDRWAEEYDASMHNAVDEGFGQYQQMASYLGAGLVNAGETGRTGGSAGLASAGVQNNLTGMTGVQGRGFGFNGSIGTYVRSSALDMLADRQTAISAVDSGLRSIPLYEKANEGLNKSIGKMRDTTEKLNEEVGKRKKQTSLDRIRFGM